MANIISILITLHPDDDIKLDTDACPRLRRIDQHAARCLLDASRIPLGLKIFAGTVTDRLHSNSSLISWLNDLPLTHPELARMFVLLPGDEFPREYQPFGHGCGMNDPNYLSHQTNADNIRMYFKDTMRGNEDMNLSESFAGGRFRGFFDPDTDYLWQAFAVGWVRAVQHMVSQNQQRNISGKAETPAEPTPNQSAIVLPN